MDASSITDCNGVYVVVKTRSENQGWALKQTAGCLKLCGSSWPNKLHPWKKAKIYDPLHEKNQGPRARREQIGVDMWGSAKVGRPATGGKAAPPATNTRNSAAPKPSLGGRGGSVGAAASSILAEVLRLDQRGSPRMGRKRGDKKSDVTVMNEADGGFYLVHR